MMIEGFCIISKLNNTEIASVVFDYPTFRTGWFALSHTKTSPQT